MRVKSYRTVDEALSEVERELNVRSRCFPGWIKDGRVNRIDAQDRLDRLASAFVVLSAVLELDADPMNALLASKNATAADSVPPNVTNSGD